MVWLDFQIVQAKAWCRPQRDYQVHADVASAATSVVKRFIEQNPKILKGRYRQPKVWVSCWGGTSLKSGRSKHLKLGHKACWRVGLHGGADEGRSEIEAENLTRGEEVSRSHSAFGFAQFISILPVWGWRGVSRSLRVWVLKMRLSYSWGCTEGLRSCRGSFSLQEDTGRSLDDIWWCCSPMSWMVWSFGNPWTEALVKDRREGTCFYYRGSDKWPRGLELYSMAMIFQGTGNFKKCGAWQLGCHINLCYYEVLCPFVGICFGVRSLCWNVEGTRLKSTFPPHPSWMGGTQMGLRWLRWSLAWIQYSWLSQARLSFYS